MRKLTVVCFLLFFVLSGCGNGSTKEKESMKNYNSFINAVISNKGIETKDIPFDHTFVVYKEKDNTYKYEVKIGNPRVSMYNIQAIAVNQELDSNANVYPCLGLLGSDANESFNMLPNQSDISLGYSSAIGLEGISRNKQFTINVLVSWKDQSGLNTYRVFFNKSYIEDANDTQNGSKVTSDSKNK